jgi:hypothetical protein
MSLYLKEYEPKEYQEKVYIQIFGKDGEYISEQDVTGFTVDQIADNMRIKEMHGLDCSIKRVFINPHK